MARVGTRAGCEGWGSWLGGIGGVVSCYKKRDGSLPGASIVMGAEISADKLSPGAMHINTILYPGDAFAFAESDVAPAGQFIAIIVTTLMRNGTDMNVLSFKNSESTAGVTERTGITFRNHEVRGDDGCFVVTILEQVKQAIEAWAIFNVKRVHVGIHTDTSFLNISTYIRKMDAS